MTDHFKDLISTMQAALAEAEAQRERLDTIAATIRINALRHGATDEQVAAFLTGEADFVGWLKAQISSPQAVRPGAPVTLTYTNWRGDTEVRRIIPRRIWFGSTAWHPEPQWILTALDVDKDKERHFALKDFGQPITVQDAALKKPAVWPDFVAPPKFENPCEGWEDPRLPDFRLIWKVARECGYSIGLHGSMRRDCDMIAAPWTDDAVLAFDLIERLCTALNAQVVGPVAGKPHGRLGWILQVDGWVKTIDISVMPRACDRNAAPPPQPVTVQDAAKAPEVQAMIRQAVEAEREACARLVDCGCDAAKKAAVLRADNGTERARACGEYACGADDAAAIRKRTEGKA